jgi:hypothetical protein
MWMALCGCSGSDAAQPLGVDCDTLSRAVVQVHGTCILSATECPISLGAYCGPSGSAGDCDQTIADFECAMGDESCSYVEPTCVRIGGSTVEVSARHAQTGFAGVMVVLPDGSCDFMPCQ